MAIEKYKYGIYAKIRKGWTVPQVKMYMDKNNITYTETDNMTDLVEAIKCHEDSQI